MSNYFKNIGNVWYELPVNGEDVLIALKDISANVRVRKYITEFDNEYNLYKVQDNDTWDSISMKLYGVEHYHWLLMLLNLSWNGNTDLPATMDIVRDTFNKSYLRPQDIIDAQTVDLDLDRWNSGEAQFKIGTRGQQVAVDFTDGVEVINLNEDLYARPVQGSTAGDIDEGIMPWASLPSTGYVVDALGIVSNPMDLYDTDEFMRRREWLQIQDPGNPNHNPLDITINERAQVEYIEYTSKHLMLSATDYVMLDNSKLSTIKVFHPKAIEVVASEIKSLLKNEN